MLGDFKTTKPFALAIVCIGTGLWLFQAIPGQKIGAWMIIVLGAVYLLVGVSQLFSKPKSKKP